MKYVLYLLLSLICAGLLLSSCHKKLTQQQQKEKEGEVVEAAPVEMPEEPVESPLEPALPGENEEILPESVNITQEYVVKEGERLMGEDRDIEIEVLSIADSRCPKNVNCITAGEVIVGVSLMAGGPPIEAELILAGDGQPSPAAEVELAGQLFRLIAVTPYPDNNAPGDAVIKSATIVLIE